MVNMCQHMGPAMRHGGENRHRYMSGERECVKSCDLYLRASEELQLCELASFVR